MSEMKTHDVDENDNEIKNWFPGFKGFPKYGTSFYHKSMFCHDFDFKFF